MSMASGQRLPGRGLDPLLAGCESPTWDHLAAISHKEHAPTFAVVLGFGGGATLNPLR